jgi:hypothetical protein
MQRVIAAGLFLVGLLCVLHAQDLTQTGVGSSIVAPSGGGGTTTFDPSNTGNTITLSGGNLTITANGSGTYSFSRSITSHSTGKLFASFLINTSNGFASYSNGIGFVNSSESLNVFLGGVDINGFGYWDDSHGYINNVSLLTDATFTNGDVIDQALDIGGGLVWIRKNGGNWNGSGTANPATGAGGVSISSAGSAPYFAAACIHNAVASITANFGATSYTYAAPAGFGNW